MGMRQVRVRLGSGPTQSGCRLWRRASRWAALNMFLAGYHAPQTISLRTAVAGGREGVGELGARGRQGNH